MEEATRQAIIATYFAELENARWHNWRHRLPDILVIAIGAAVCGAGGWEDVELSGEARHEWLRSILELPHGLPSSDTFFRVSAAVPVEEFEGCFIRWVLSVEGLTRGRVVAVDDRTLRRSYDRAAGKSALHIVSASGAGNRLILDQRRVDGKSSEITVMLELLDVRECWSTSDRSICTTS